MCWTRSRSASSTNGRFSASVSAFHDLPAGRGMDRAAGLASAPPLPGPTAPLRPRLVPLPGRGKGLRERLKVGAVEAEGRLGTGGRREISGPSKTFPPSPRRLSVAPGSGFPLTTRTRSRNWPGVGGTGDPTIRSSRYRGSSKAVENKNPERLL